MDFKINSTGMKKFEKDLTKKLEKVSREVQEKSAGLSPKEVARMAKATFAKNGVELNDEGVQKFVSAAKSSEN